MVYKQHVFQSLTVENIAYEVFSPFASIFEEIRKVSRGYITHSTLLITAFVKVEIDFFLKNWQEIRTSDAMKKVWHQIRIGRHPGFEEGMIFLLYTATEMLRHLQCGQRLL